MIKSKKATTNMMGLIVGIILAIVVALAFISLITGKSIPLLLGSYKCKAPAGYCTETCQGFSLELNCKNENEVCCAGKDPKEKDGGVGGDEESPKPEIQPNVCPPNKVCWKFMSNPDDSNFHSLTEWVYTDCLWDEKSTKLNKDKILFEASIENAICCKLQIGGINSNDYSYFGSGVKSAQGVVKDNICKASLDFDFTNPPETYFKPGVWASSYDTRTNMPECFDLNIRKPMFKLDFVYWTDLADCNNINAPSTASKAALITINELKPEEETPAGGPGMI